MLLVGNQREHIILNLSHYILLSDIKLSRYKMGIKFDKDPLALEQNNYARKIVNVNIVQDLDACPRNLVTTSYLRTVYLEQLVQ